MKQQEFALLAIHLEPNRAQFQKTIAVNDFYWGEPDFPYPMGMIQNTGNVLAEMIPAEAPPLLAPLTKLIPQVWARANCRTCGWLVAAN